MIFGVTRPKSTLRMVSRSIKQRDRHQTGSGVWPGVGRCSMDGKRGSSGEVVGRHGIGAWEHGSMGQYEVACLDRPEWLEGSESGAAPALRIEHGRLIAP